MKPVIQVNNLSKCYRIGGGPRGQYRTLRESLSEAVVSPWRRFRELSLWDSTHTTGDASPNPRTLWALKDVSFDIEPGEVVGIIGRNGAGKSTLLKILSRITEPSNGFVEYHGRIGSLLEVGTGFHMELTGRENIYLNGSILGMSRLEIERHFDEIVDFSGVERFLETPVKRYSSGMVVRLAFAVAAHLNPEIMIIDEVLAVGDIEFQRKCLGKMQDVAGSGRTILFVSHNMAAVENLCTRVLYLKQGELIEQGPSDVVLRSYQQSLDSSSSVKNLHELRTPDSQEVIQEIQLLGPDQHQSTVFAIGDSVTFRIHFHSPNTHRDIRFAISIESSIGQKLLFMHSLQQHGPFEELGLQGVVECRIPELPLSPGLYYISVSAGVIGHGRIDHLDRVRSFTVEATDYYGTGRVPDSKDAQFISQGIWSVID